MHVNSYDLIDQPFLFCFPLPHTDDIVQQDALCQKRDMGVPLKFI